MGTAPRVRCELGRAFQRPDRRNHRAALQRGAMIRFEVVRDIVVGSRDCVGAVPRAAKRIVGQDVGQRGVGGVSARERPRIAERRSERVDDRTARAGRPAARGRPAGGLERVDLGLGASEHRRRGEDLRQVVERIDRGDQDRVTCFRRKLGQATRERPLEASSQRECRLRSTEASDACQARGSSTSASGLPSAASQDLVEICSAEADTGCFEHLAGRGLAEFGDVELVETGRVKRPGEAAPRCPDDDDRIATHPTCHERERGLRRSVEPLHVVDPHTERPGRRELREQVQRRERDQERLRSRTDHDPQRLGQRIALRGWQSVEAVQGGTEKVIQPCIRKRGLRLHAGRPQNEEAGGAGVISGCSQQRRLPDAGVADHQEGAAMLDRAVDQAVEPIKLDFSPDDLALDPHLEIAPTQCRRGQAFAVGLSTTRLWVTPDPAGGGSGRG